MRTLRTVLTPLVCCGGLALTAGCDDEIVPASESLPDGALVVPDGGPLVPDGGAVDSGGPTDSGEPVVDCTGRPAEAPSLRSEASLAYDAAKDRLLMFGGNVAEVMCPEFSREPSNDVWAFELDCNNWRRIPTPGGPVARVRHAVAVDTTRNRMILFGGRSGPFGNYTYLNDVWAFDLQTDAWSEIQTTGPTPARRDDTVIEYDAGRDRIVLFGGDTDRTGALNGPQADLWALSLATGAWSRITPTTNGPAARLLHGSANLGDRMVVFGGAQSFFTYRSDLWVFDFTLESWVQVYASAAAPGPRVRFGPAVFADPSGGRAVVFAGHDPGIGTAGDPGAIGNRNDTWSADLGGAGWTEIYAGDELNPDAPPSSQCNFPPDFTSIDLSSPDRRSAFPYAQNDTHAFVFGGNTDCGRANDVWSFELETNTWTELWAANGGVSCPHSGRVDCTNLCF